MHEPLDKALFSRRSEKVEFSGVKTPLDGYEFKVKPTLHLVTPIPPKVIEIPLRFKV
jgi:hypothetical protein